MAKSEIIKWYNSCNTFIDDRVETFLEQFYPDSQIEDIGTGYRLQPCPICGHRDCATANKSQIRCYSCGWSGNFVATYIAYKVDQGVKKGDAIKHIEVFCHMSYPIVMDAKRRAEDERMERLADIRRIATDFYNKQLIDTTDKYKLENDTRKMMPLQYLTNIRGHEENTLAAFKVGFSLNFDVLQNLLLMEEYSKEEIQEARVWVPEGMFTYPQWDPFTKEILRVNTKNPFGAKIWSAKKEEEILVKGFSSGDKVLGFAPGFSFKKKIVVVEGENDAQTVFESGFTNVCWIAGQLNDTQLDALKVAKDSIYLFMDNDHAGEEYIEKINDALPEKKLFVIEYEKAFNDPDDYYQKCGAAKPIETLIDAATPLETKSYVTSKDNKTWVIENRHRRIVFEMSSFDGKTGAILGKASLFIDGELIDSKPNTVLSKLAQKYKPLSLFLDEKINEYYNAPEELLSRTRDELIEIYIFSKYKNDIVKAIARQVYEAEEDIESQIVYLTKKLGINSVDAILKEVNEIQNKYKPENANMMPTIKISQFFSIKNNDSYFYYTDVKSDGESIRRIPFLLRNDGLRIRLDLFKRKDSQCMLLIDNKYELPEEVNEAKIKLSEASLIATWANRFSEGSVSESEICPHDLVHAIEKYIKIFYYHKNQNVHKIVALWIYGTYFYELFGQYPYLFLNGEKGSGKTALDLVIYMFALNAKLAVNISESALFRTVSLEGGTMILDEIENLTSRGKTQDSLMATILKGGYQKGSHVYRQNMDTNSTDSFDIFSPKVISNIYGIEDVLEDRCIKVNSFRMQVKSKRLADPKYYLNECMDEVREVTSKCVLSALKHFQALNTITVQTQMITDNARLTQLLTPLLALARFVDYSKNDVGYTRFDENTDFSAVSGDYVKAFHEYYESDISPTKSDIESGTPEGVIKAIITTVAHELADFVARPDRNYTIPTLHKYQNEIKYEEDSGEFWLDAIHLKVFMEEILIGWTINPKSIHTWIKTSFNVEDTKRRVIKLTNSSQELIKELKNEHSMKVYHYKFNVKDFVLDKNYFMTGVEDAKLDESVKELF